MTRPTTPKRQYLTSCKWASKINFLTKLTFKSPAPDPALTRNVRPAVADRFNPANLGRKNETLGKWVTALVLPSALSVYISSRVNIKYFTVWLAAYTSVLSPTKDQDHCTSVTLTCRLLFVSSPWRLRVRRDVYGPFQFTLRVRADPSGLDFSAAWSLLSNH